MNLNGTLRTKSYGTTKLEDDGERTKIKFSFDGKVWRTAPRALNIPENFARYKQTHHTQLVDLLKDTFDDIYNPIESYEFSLENQCEVQQKIEVERKSENLKIIRIQVWKGLGSGSLQEDPNQLYQEINKLKAEIRIKDTQLQEKNREIERLQRQCNNTGTNHEKIEMGKFIEKMKSIQLFLDQLQLDQDEHKFEGSQNGNIIKSLQAHQIEIEKMIEDMKKYNEALKFEEDYQFSYIGETIEFANLIKDSYRNISERLQNIYQSINHKSYFSYFTDFLRRIFPCSKARQINGNKSLSQKVFELITFVNSNEEHLDKKIGKLNAEKHHIQKQFDDKK